MPSIRKISFKGLDSIEKKLNFLAGKVERGAMRDALAKASKPNLKKAKQTARAIEKTSTLRKSLKRKIKTFKNGMVIAYIGPDRRVTSNDYGGNHTPANIAHLIEFGFHDRAGNKVPGKKFLEIAFNSTKKESIRIYKAEIGSSVQKIAKRLEKKGVF